MTTPHRTALLLAIIGSLAAAACTAEQSSADDTAAASPGETLDTLAGGTGWIARPERIGDIRTGMSRADLIEIVGQPTRFGYDARERCTYVGGSALPDGVQVMIFDSTVARIDVMEPGVPTLEGAQVGDAESSVLQRYSGRVQVTPHPYTAPEGHYLTVTPPGDTLHRIIFETDGRRVTAYRVGRRPQVEWIEGCS